MLSLLGKWTPHCAQRTISSAGADTSCLGACLRKDFNNKYTTMMIASKKSKRLMRLLHGTPHDRGQIRTAYIVRAMHTWNKPIALRGFTPQFFPSTKRPASLLAFLLRGKEEMHRFLPPRFYKPSALGRRLISQSIELKTGSYTGYRHWQRSKPTQIANEFGVLNR